MRYLAGEEGQGFVEYALILVIVAIGCLIILTFFGEEVNNFFIFIRDNLIALMTK